VELTHESLPIVFTFGGGGHVDVCGRRLFEPIESVLDGRFVRDLVFGRFGRQNGVKLKSEAALNALFPVV